MSSRFPTARDVGEAFPLVLQSISRPLTSDQPEAFAAKLLDEGKPKEAVAFCAFYLSRRAAVEWACMVINNLPDTEARGSNVPLQAAISWLEEPVEKHRRLAHKAAEEHDPTKATTWVARTASWSGGNLTFSDQAIVQTPPDLAAQGARAAILLGLSCVPREQHDEYLHNAVTTALELAKLEG